MNRGRGFTLVELIVVIAVIAILATLATLGVGRYLADGRDSQRAANASTISEALEKYYDQNGEYPSCSAVTAAPGTVSSNTLKGLDESALLVPSPASGTTNSVRCGATLALTGTDFFEYIGDGSPDCASSGSCLTYTIRYRSEGDNQIKEIKSRRETNIATSGNIRLSVSNLSFKTLTLNWTAVQNSLSYTVEQSNTNTFTTIQNTFTSTTPSYSVTNLMQGQQYFFRVKAIGGSQQGQWSEPQSATALVLGAPQNFAISGAATATTVPFSWSAAENADSNTRYYVQRSTDSFATVSTSTAINGTSHTATGLATGTTYKFRVVAGTSTVSPIYYSSPSNEVTTAAQPPAPTGVSATANSSTQITVSWSAVSGASGYIVRYGTSSGSLTSATTAAAGTSRAITGLLQGQPYYFQVFTVQNGVESNASTPTATATTSIDAPGAYNMSAWVDQGQSLYSTSPVNCPSGTTANFYWHANGGFWVSGTQHRTTGYWLNYGQSVTTQVATRCEKDGVVSGWTWSSNTASLSRPGMNFGMWTGSDMCAGGFCGRQLFSSWNNVCGTGAPRIYARQLSAYANWVADSPSNDQLLFKGASSPGVWVDYYDVNIGCTAASGSIRVISAYRCNGCS